MSGHSKWKNIMHKKEKTDAQKAKVFTKIGKEIAIAVKEGGADPNANAKLRDLIQKAKSNNVPNDNIDRIIKKASGADAVAYEEIIIWKKMVTRLWRKLLQHTWKVFLRYIKRYIKRNIL